MTGGAWPKSVWPKVYELVWTRFPEAESIEQPGLKPRPSLVLGVYEEEDGGALLVIAPGTTRLKLERRPFDFRVTNYAEMQACGLSFATRFDLDAIIPLPYTRDWFAPLTAAGKTTPVIGRLSDAMIMAFQTHMAWRAHFLGESDT